MGLRRLSELCAGLVANGRDAATPVAVVSAGTTPSQEVVVGTLADVGERAEHLAQPALVVVGEVVALGLLDAQPELASSLGGLLRAAKRLRAA
jgi:siroheme synthase